MPRARWHIQPQLGWLHCGQYVSRVTCKFSGPSNSEKKKKKLTRSQVDKYKNFLPINLTLNENILVIMQMKIFVRNKLCDKPRRQNIWLHFSLNIWNQIAIVNNYQLSRLYKENKTEEASTPVGKNSFNPCANLMWKWRKIIMFVAFLDDNVNFCDEWACWQLNVIEKKNLQMKIFFSFESSY